MNLQLQNLHGSDISDVLEELATLRITVFREYPYLYDGTTEYEKQYLQSYLECPDSIVVLACDEGRPVGASTGLPLAAADSDFQRPFENAGNQPVDTWFYCAESVLLPEYRGQGFGHRFFDEREAHAAKLDGITHTCFCAVERPPTHPARPETYRDLEPFWTARGYQKREDLRTSFPWKEVSETEETVKPLIFWTKEIKR
ncbi:MAG: GNAT family N-acetyltransferase [Verrucomicrobiales bacterium]|nr:GNAT family N-acetyltransferase [Verrucomicrobiales bacterium]